MVNKRSLYPSIWIRRATVSMPKRYLTWVTALNLTTAADDDAPKHTALSAPTCVQNLLHDPHRASLQALPFSHPSRPNKTAIHPNVFF